MHVVPIGLPAALNAWHERPAEPVLQLRCAAEPDCGTVVGAVYRSPRAVVVESWTSSPEDSLHRPDVDLDIEAVTDPTQMLAKLAGRDPTGTPDDVARRTVQAQVDLLHTAFYWHHPRPFCPVHGELRLQREELAAAVRADRAVFTLSDPADPADPADPDGKR